MKNWTTPAVVLMLLLSISLGLYALDRLIDQLTIVFLGGIIVSALFLVAHRRRFGPKTFAVTLALSGFVVLDMIDAGSLPVLRF